MSRSACIEGVQGSEPTEGKCRTFRSDVWCSQSDYLYIDSVLGCLEANRMFGFDNELDGRRRLVIVTWVHEESRRRCTGPEQ